MQIIDKSLKEKSGIYCIINSINNKKYIGSSKDLQQRLTSHKVQLKSNKHKNRILQNSVNKYGLDNFYYSILEFCNIENLLVREQYYITNTNSEYNIVKEVLEKGVLGKTIYQYSLDGTFIKKYDYIIDACKENNIHRSTILRYLKGIYKRGGNFLWSLEFKDKLYPYIKIKRNLTKLYQKVVLKNIQTNENLYFNSLNECAIFMNLFPGEVSKAIKTGRKFKNKFIITKAPLDSDI